MVRLLLGKVFQFKNPPSCLPLLAVGACPAGVFGKEKGSEANIFIQSLMNEEVKFLGQQRTTPSNRQIFRR